jgi:glycosyltransferase involved in cell wall biosynthesis
VPCSNSLAGLKKTIESLVLQTRINGTRVLIADIDSSDGSVQYAQQMEFNLRKILNIEPVHFSKDKENLLSSIVTPYVFWISPGNVLKDPDFFINQVNTFSPSEKLIAYTERSLAERVLLKLSRNKYSDKNIGALCKKEDSSQISFSCEKERIFIDLPDIKKRTIKI